jgi:signal transduction histidine kinase
MLDARSEEKPLILLVDDRQENLAILEELLRDLRIDTARALSGNEALRQSLKHDFALVLMDVQMPEMDGFETAELMRANPKTCHLPIIFITAGMKDMNYQFRGYDAGAVDYLTKPIEPIVLRSKVSIFRDLHLQRRELELHREHLQSLVDQRTTELRKAAEELEQRVMDRTNDLQQANRQLEAFAYSVSHDLRAPLRHIDAFSQILITDYNDRLDEAAQNILQRIVIGCNQMDKLITSILSLAKTARQPINKIAVNPKEMAEEVFHELTADRKSINVDFVVGNLPECHADPLLLHQVMVNLIGNAIKYSSTRESPRVEVGAAEKNGRPVYFVRDNGVGFDMAYADKLFGVFQRLHSSSEYEGTGLGLAIVENIVQRHGGRIWAEAVLDKGATFYFTI